MADVNDVGKFGISWRIDDKAKSAFPILIILLLIILAANAFLPMILPKETVTEYIGGWLPVETEKPTLFSQIIMIVVAIILGLIVGWYGTNKFLKRALDIKQLTAKIIGFLEYVKITVACLVSVFLTWTDKRFLAAQIISYILIALLFLSAPAMATQYGLLGGLGGGIIGILGIIGMVVAGITVFFASMRLSMVLPAYLVIGRVKDAIKDSWKTTEGELIEIFCFYLGALITGIAKVLKWLILAGIIVFVLMAAVMFVPSLSIVSVIVGAIFIAIFEAYFIIVGLFALAAIYALIKPREVPKITPLPREFSIIEEEKPETVLTMAKKIGKKPVRKKRVTRKRITKRKKKKKA